MNILLTFITLIPLTRDYLLIMVPAHKNSTQFVTLCIVNTSLSYRRDFFCLFYEFTSIIGRKHTQQLFTQKWRMVTLFVRDIFGSRENSLIQ